MLGNFSYCNPTKLYFGEDSLQSLNEELPKYGANIMLIYGGLVQLQLRSCDELFRSFLRPGTEGRVVHSVLMGDLTCEYEITILDDIMKQYVKSR